MSITIFDSNSVNIDGIEIAASNVNNTKKIKFTNISNPTQKLSFHGTNGNYSESNLNGVLNINFSIENQIFYVFGGITSVNIVNIDSGISGFLIFKNMNNVTHNFNWPSNVLVLTSVNLKTSNGEYYVIEYSLHDSNVHIREIS